MLKIVNVTKYVIVIFDNSSNVHKSCEHKIEYRPLIVHTYMFTFVNTIIIKTHVNKKADSYHLSALRLIVDTAANASQQKYTPIALGAKPLKL